MESVTIKKRGFQLFKNKLRQLFGIWRDFLGENKTKKEIKKTKKLHKKTKGKLERFYVKDKEF